MAEFSSFFPLILSIPVFVNDSILTFSLNPSITPSIIIVRFPSWKSKAVINSSYVFGVNISSLDFTFFTKIKNIKIKT